MQAIQALPYVLTVVLLAGFIGRSDGAEGARAALREGALRPDDPGRRRCAPAAARARRGDAYAPYSKFRGRRRGARRTGPRPCRLQCRERRLSARRVRRGRGAERHGAGRRPPRPRRCWWWAKGRRGSRPAAAAGRSCANLPPTTAPCWSADGHGVQRRSRWGSCCRTASGRDHLATRMMPTPSPGTGSARVRRACTAAHRRAAGLGLGRPDAAAAAMRSAFPYAELPGFPARRCGRPCR